VETREIAAAEKIREVRRGSDKARRAIREYHDAVASTATHPWSGGSLKRLRRAAYDALLFLGGQGDPPAVSLKDYDHRRHGPFLGVSDEGSAARAVRKAALRSAKVRAVGPCPPIVVGVALDAERLGAVGETPVGPREFATIRVECMGRILTTTNVGTQVNLRFFERYPVVTVPKGHWRHLSDDCRKHILAALDPFVRSPGGPRRITIYVEFERTTRRSRRERLRILRALAETVRRQPGTQKDLHRVGLVSRIGLGPKGKAAAMFTMALARDAGLRDVLIDGVVRRAAQDTLAMPGLLTYLAPGLVGPILRHALRHGVRLRTRNTVDSETVARTVWSSLNTARAMGFELGKYGVYPLTLEETEQVVARIQAWCGDWSAAPVFFVDQGLLTEEKVYAGSDVAAGVRRWLATVASHGVRVVLIDTMEKSRGWRLMKHGHDPRGILGPNQVRGLDAFAAELGVRVLWAGGITLPQIYEFGRMRVFGIYVTSAAARAGPVTPEYETDPLLAVLKEPTREGVTLAKLLLDAGFLVSELANEAPGPALRITAEAFVSALEKSHTPTAVPPALERLVVQAWRRRWRATGADSGRCLGDEAGFRERHEERAR